MTTERSWLEAPDLVVETKYGKAKLVFTGDGHIYLDSNHNSGTDPSVGLTVRAVRYGVSAHLHFREGAWQVDEPYLYMSRADSLGHTKSDASRAARVAVREAIEAAVNAAAVTRPDLVAQGEARAVNNRLQDLDAKIAEAEAALDTLKSTRAQLLLRAHAMEASA